MRTFKNKYLAGGGFALLLAGSLSMASLSAEADTPAPTKADAVAALDHIDSDQAIIRAYLDSLSTPTPTPTGSVSPSETPSATPTTTGPTPTVSASVTPTASATPTTPPAGAERSSGLPWNSGVNPQNQSADRVNEFVSYRGTPVDNITLFPPRDSWGSINDPQYIAAGLPTTFDPVKDDLVYTVPLWPGNMSVSNTGSKAQWEALANTVKAKDANAYIRLGWEGNLSGNYWAYTSSNKTAWISSFNTAVGYMKGVAPNLRIVFNPNKGGDQTSGCSGTTCTRSIFQAVKANVDVYGIDSYDSYPALTSNAASATHMNDLLGESLAYAKANGKKFAVPEWGLGCNTSGCQWQGNAGGDNPRYLTEYVNWFAANAGDLAFESYFDDPSGYIRAALDVTPIGPNGPAAYRSAICAKTVKC
jgi:hypothetical protein